MNALGLSDLSGGFVFYPEHAATHAAERYGLGDAVKPGAPEPSYRSMINAIAEGIRGSPEAMPKLIEVSPPHHPASFGLLSG